MVADMNGIQVDTEDIHTVDTEDTQAEDMEDTQVEDTEDTQAEDMEDTQAEDTEDTQVEDTVDIQDTVVAAPVWMVHPVEQNPSAWALISKTLERVARSPHRLHGGIGFSASQAESFSGGYGGGYERYPGGYGGYPYGGYGGYPGGGYGGYPGGGYGGYPGYGGGGFGVGGSTSSANSFGVGIGFRK
ncbi:FAM10 family protein At4g22670-like [Neodiprion virginianus]|uniref:FAM10 family protein At4g22670-like n=1 Tax=Neodiprion virginianus TaxID=2961670 RepID=UPI001EE73370|nr:FAM10 family protein At4g22670-like [Neodiprion virginianus]